VTPIGSEGGRVRGRWEKVGNMLMVRTCRFGAAVGVCLGLATPACLDHPLKPAEYDTEGVASGALPLSLNKDVDILFVIDNSGSMAEEQATLARNFERFIAKLEETDVDANYRIAVTTTDAGHVYSCGPTGPEAGRFQLTSCLQRGEQEFIFNGTNRFAEACASICTHDELTTTPTRTLLDPQEKPRPWLERIEGASNLPAGVGTVDAFQCFGPQGIAGCGFESTLEAMHLALLRAQQTEEPSYGFMRPGAILAIVFVTDEEDCSARKDPEFRDAWDPEGPGAFFSEENLEDGPTSEVCWNAGVECDGGPGTYTDCRPADKAVDGTPTDGDHSVLYSVQRYIDFVQDVEDRKRELDGTADVLVAVLAGVPSGYTDGQAEIVYSDGDDAQFLSDMGIGAGCDSANGKAVPPVRLRAFAEAYALSDEIEDRNVYSVCEDDYSPALEQIGNMIGERLKPACMPKCVADVAPLEPGVDPQCTLTEIWRDAAGKSHEGSVKQCAEDGGGTPFLSDDQELCYVMLTGAEMHEDCIAGGWNLQFDVLRAPTAERAQGSTVSASCVVSQQEDIDCPGL
jgi:hypothetical protein